MEFDDYLRKDDWIVKDAPFSEVKKMVADYHYARGGSNTYVYAHGLYHKHLGFLAGIAWWLPPTKVACESVNKEEWKRVLALSRLVILPNMFKNSCSFLLSRSVKLIKKDARFVSLVTYADESQGHTGSIYRAANWTYCGRTGPTTRWVDSTGKQVSIKSTKSRTVKQMKELGYIRQGDFYKHKYVLHLGVE